MSIFVPDGDHVMVESLFEPDFDGVAQIRTAIENSHTDAEIKINRTVLADRDWVARSQQNLKPVELTKMLKIVAPWHAIDASDELAVIINPGTSFGTGHHETTLMCAKNLADLELSNCTVLDYGCGSGVLAITALVLGAKFAWGVDIDPDALIDSQANAARNGVEQRYQCVLPGELPSKLQADVVVANLFADALDELSETLTRLTRPGGELVMSGILHAQVDRIVHRYFRAFEISTESLGQWSMIIGRRHHASDQ